MLGRVIGSSIRRDHTSRRLAAKARLRGLLLLLALALGALTLAVLPGGGGAGGKGIGRAKYRLDAAKYFAPFSTSQYAPWVTAHITLIKGYPPFSDRYLGMFGLPLIGYHDPATEGQAPLAPAQIEEYVAKAHR